MSSIRNNFLEQNKGKSIRLIFSNGFQIHGVLVDFDYTSLLLETNAYSSDPVVIPLAAINAFVPGGSKSKK